MVTGIFLKLVFHSFTQKYYSECGTKLG